MSGATWTKFLVDINTGFDIKPSNLISIQDSYGLTKISFINDKSINYYQEGLDDGFDIMYPDLCYLGVQEANIAQWANGSIQDCKLTGVFNSTIGTLTKDAINPVIVLCGYANQSSSSSSSSSSIDSSSSSSSSSSI